MGGNGWRLPTVEELKTLGDKRRSPKRPFLDITVFLDVDEHESIYWTSTPYSGSRNTQVYCVDFYFVSATNCGLLDPRRARLVRRGP